jgi:hypothetical protein
MTAAARGGAERPKPGRRVVAILLIVASLVLGYEGLLAAEDTAASSRG